MNTSIKTMAWLMLASVASCSRLPTETPLPGRADPVRTILLAEKPDGTGNNCRFDAKTDQVWLNKENHGCENDEMRYVKLDNVRSAVLMVFKSNDCDENKGWRSTLRTYIDPLSTSWIDIDDLRKNTVGAIITRGVLLEDNYDDGDTTRGKLSCVTVTVSQPPVPAP